MITPRVTGPSMLNTKKDPEVISQNIHMLALLKQDEHRRIDCKESWAVGRRNNDHARLRVSRTQYMYPLSRQQ